MACTSLTSTVKNANIITYLIMLAVIWIKCCLELFCLIHIGTLAIIIPIGNMKISFLKHEHQPILIIL